MIEGVCACCFLLLAFSVWGTNSHTLHVPSRANATTHQGITETTMEEVFLKVSHIDDPSGGGRGGGGGGGGGTASKTSGIPI